MRKFFIILSMLLAIPAFAQTETNIAAQQPAAVLIRNISIEGFLLKDRKPFAQLFKYYRNKRLSQKDINGILDAIKIIYEEAGYLKLVTINYQIYKGRLTFMVSFVKS